MQVRQVILAAGDDWAALDDLQAWGPDGLLVFAGLAWFERADLFPALRARFPAACLIGCSTAGEISRGGVQQGGCVLTGLRFDATRLRGKAVPLARMEDSLLAGLALGRDLGAPDLQAVLVYGPGVAVNGSALVAGLAQGLERSVPITGGLAADAGAFSRTWVLGDQGVSDRQVVALGLYGERLRLGHGSSGGWLPFGPSRRVTRAAGNLLHELDGEPALTMYKRYLGEHARDLPASGLLFPFLMQDAGTEHDGLIRTILAVDEASGSLTLAGEVAEGSQLKLMQASTDRLIGGAERAAEAAREGVPGGATLAILVSCVGRQLVMGSEVDEEVEAVAGVLGTGTVLTGFYSNGEICPVGAAGPCQLHNQTMTITTMAEEI